MKKLTKEQVEEKRRALTSGAYLDDYIAEILLRMDLDRITTHPISLHSAFYSLKDKYDELNEITFDESGVTPISDELDSVFFRLGLTGLVSCQNMHFDHYVIRKESRDVFEKMVTPVLTEKQRTNLKKCAKELSNILRPYSKKP